MTKTPPQPSARAGEVLVQDGRWNLAALAKVQLAAEQEPVWTAGPLGQALSMGGTSVARINRPLHRGESRPWIIRIKGYERWHEPTRLAPHWHYTAAWSAPTLAKAKIAILDVVHSIPVLGP